MDGYRAQFIRTMFIVANYPGGNVAVFAIENDGRLSQIIQVIQHSGTGKNKKRQAGPHAHSINLAASGKFAMAADLVAF